MVDQFAMPTTGLAQTEFELQYNDAINTLRSGSAFATELAPSFWEAKIVTAELIRRSERWRIWRAFLDSLRGSKKVALLYDHDLPYPQEYDNFDGLVKAGTSTAFDGTGDVSAYDTYEPQLTGLPADFQFRMSDYVEFNRGGRYSLHRLIEDAQANSSGVVTIKVEPAIPNYYDNVATDYNVKHSRGEFVLVPGSVSAPRGLISGTISFTARSRAV